MRVRSIPWTYDLQPQTRPSPVSARKLRDRLARAGLSLDQTAMLLGLKYETVLDFFTGARPIPMRLEILIEFSQRIERADRWMRTCQPISADELRARLLRVEGMTIKHFARVVGVTERSVTRWVGGHHKVPAWIEMAVLLLERWAEANRMFRKDLP